MNITIDELMGQIQALDYEAITDDATCLKESTMLTTLSNHAKLDGVYLNMVRAVQATNSLRPILAYGIQIGYRIAEAHFLRKMVEGE